MQDARLRGSRREGLVPCGRARGGCACQESETGEQQRSAFEQVLQWPYAPRHVLRCRPMVSEVSKVVLLAVRRALAQRLPRAQGRAGRGRRQCCLVRRGCLSHCFFFFFFLPHARGSAAQQRRRVEAGTFTCEPCLPPAAAAAAAAGAGWSSGHASLTASLSPACIAVATRARRARRAAPVPHGARARRGTSLSRWPSPGPSPGPRGQACACGIMRMPPSIA